MSSRAVVIPSEAPAERGILILPVEGPVSRAGRTARRRSRRSRRTAAETHYDGESLGRPGLHRLGRSLFCRGFCGLLFTSLPKISPAAQGVLGGRGSPGHSGFLRRSARSAQSACVFSTPRPWWVAWPGESRSLDCGADAPPLGMTILSTGTMRIPRSARNDHRLGKASPAGPTVPRVFQPVWQTSGPGRRVVTSCQRTWIPRSGTPT